VKPAAGASKAGKTYVTALSEAPGTAILAYSSASKLVFLKSLLFIPVLLDGGGKLADEVGDVG
jgi:hypothetical protein